MKFSSLIPLLSLSLHAVYAANSATCVKYANTIVGSTNRMQINELLTGVIDEEGENIVYKLDIEHCSFALKCSKGYQKLSGELKALRMLFDLDVPETYGEVLEDCILMELLGENLFQADLVHKYPMTKVVQYAAQIFRLISQIHDRKYIIRNIHPKHFIYSAAKNRFFLISPGYLSKEGQPLQVGYISPLFTPNEKRCSLASEYYSFGLVLGVMFGLSMEDIEKMVAATRREDLSIAIAKAAFSRSAYENLLNSFDGFMKHSALHANFKLTLPEAPRAIKDIVVACLEYYPTNRARREQIKQALKDGKLDSDPMSPAAIQDEIYFGVTPVAKRVTRLRIEEFPQECELKPPSSGDSQYDIPFVEETVKIGDFQGFLRYRDVPGAVYSAESCGTRIYVLVTEEEIDHLLKPLKKAVLTIPTINKATHIELKLVGKSSAKMNTRSHRIERYLIFLAEGFINHPLTPMSAKAVASVRTIVKKISPLKLRESKPFS